METPGSLSYPQKKPRSQIGSGVLIVDYNQHYRLPLLDALSGLSFALEAVVVAVTWVARLQLPFFHLMAGSGQAVQYQPDSSSDARLQP